MIRLLYLLFVVTVSVLSQLPNPVFAQSADWRNQIGTFRIGLIGSSSKKKDLARLRPFKELLQKELSMPVEIFLARDFTTLIQAQVSSRIEYAIFSSTAYATAWTLCECVSPLVSPLAEDGSRGFSSVLISRRSLGLKLTTLKNRTVLAGHEESFAAHQFPKGILRNEGIDWEKIGWKLEIAKTSEQSLNRFADGEVDAFFGWQPSQGAPEKQPVSGTVARLRNFRQNIADDLDILWRSPSVPYGVHSVRTSLAGEAQDILLALMLTLREQNPGIYKIVEPTYSGGFTQSEQEDFAAVIDYIEGIKKEPRQSN